MPEDKDKELFHGWDIEAIWRDARLKPIDCNLFIHLVLITREMRWKPLYDGSIAYEAPIAFLVKNTTLSLGGVHKTLGKLQKCGYIRLVQFPGTSGKKTTHIVFTDLHRVNPEPTLLQNAVLQQVEAAPPGMNAYQITSKHGYGMFYSPDTTKENKKDKKD